jgi:hypothetical protein
MWFTMATILNLVLLLMCMAFRALWKEAGRRWTKETDKLKAENKKLRRALLQGQRLFKVYLLEPRWQTRRAVLKHFEQAMKGGK